MTASGAPIVVATDFSTRSDRALWRATLLAKAAGMPLIMIHVVDDDRPERLVDNQLESARIALEAAVRSAREVDGVDASAHLVRSDVVPGVITAAEEARAELIVLGPHRRQWRDSILGTTAGRIISGSDRPVLIANALPSPPYERIVVALEFGEASAHAARRLAAMPFADQAQVIAFHAFDAPAEAMLKRGMTQPEDVQQYVADEQSAAAERLAALLGASGLVAARQIVSPVTGSPARTIVEAATAHGVSLIALGTRQRTGVKRWLLGSVAEEVAEAAEMDVLVIPNRSEQG